MAKNPKKKKTKSETPEAPGRARRPAPSGEPSHDVPPIRLEPSRHRPRHRDREEQDFRDEEQQSRPPEIRERALVLHRTPGGWS